MNQPTPPTPLNTPNAALPLRRVSAAVALGVAAVVLAGCGSSPRDDFYESRSIINTPIAGTGEPLGRELAEVIASDSTARVAAKPQPAANTP